MPETPTESKPRRRPWSLLLFVVPLLGLLLGPTLVRGFVDHRIAGVRGQVLPEFRIADTGGRTWTPAVLRGRRAVLHFVRSHCEACAAEAPVWRDFEPVAARADVQVLHVLTDAVLGFPATDTAATLREDAFAAPVLLADAAFVDAFHGSGWSNVTPVSYFVDRDGVVRTTRRGAQPLAALAAALGELP